MKLSRLTAFFLALSFIGGLLYPQIVLSDAKRRVAVLPFEYGAVSSSVGTCDVGKGITTLLVTRLVNDGTFSVVERQMLDSILKEQNFSVSDRADPTTAAKIGKLLGVDAIIVGTVTQFGLEKRSSSMTIPSISVPYFSMGSLGSIKSASAKAKVAIDARLVDINTGEILGAVNGSGQSSRKGSSMFSNYDIDFCSSDFASSIAGEATLAACDQVIGQLIAMAAKIPDNQSFIAANVQGKIADVTGTQVIVNVGKNNGLKVGDSLQAERAYKTVKDPVTGRVLKELTATIGVITISQVDADSATGSVVRGNDLRVGDNVRKVTTDVSAVLLQPVPTIETSGAAANNTTKSSKSSPTPTKKLF